MQDRHGERLLSAGLRTGWIGGCAGHRHGPGPAVDMPYGDGLEVFAHDTEGIQRELTDKTAYGDLRGLTAFGPGRPAAQPGQHDLTTTGRVQHSRGGLDSQLAVHGAGRQEGRGRREPVTAEVVRLPDPARRELRPARRRAGGRGARSTRRACRSCRPAQRARRSGPATAATRVRRSGRRDRPRRGRVPSVRRDRRHGHRATTCAPGGSRRRTPGASARPHPGGGRGSGSARSGRPPSCRPRRTCRRRPGPGDSASAPSRPTAPAARQPPSPRPQPPYRRGAHATPGRRSNTNRHDRWRRDDGSQHHRTRGETAVPHDDQDVCTTPRRPSRSAARSGGQEGADGGAGEDGVNL